MSEWNVYYRAFLEYRKKTAENKNIAKLCDALERSATDNDKLESVRTYCVIDEDWVEILETGLDHVEKAVREERQFIRKQGEVVPIEKLKRVSTETVRHLAQHSEYITKEPEEGETLTPEKLYMSENLSDYAVYENRFLYMLLCYLRDFIRVRLDKILEFGRTYRLSTNIEKRVRMGSKSFRYKAEMKYEDKNDAFTDEFFASAPIIERIETSQRMVTSLLMTPLMKEVAKAPMLHPPITPTNVLRMNVHFKAAMEMYGKLSAYTKDGYEIKEIKNSYQPLPDEMLAEEASLMALQQYISYKYGNKLSESLRAEYEEEEKRLRDELEKRTEEKLAQLKAQLAQDGKSKDEYIMLLEERIRQQEKDSVDLRLAQKKIEHLDEKIQGLSVEIGSLTEKNDALQGVIAEKERGLLAAEKRFAEEKKEIEDACKQEIGEKEKACAEEVCSAQEKARNVEADCRKKCLEADEKCEKITSEKIFVQAQLDGLRQQYGLISPQEDFTSKERFLELEKEYEAFEELFRTQWGYTKKRIRRDILGRKPKE